MHVGDYGTNFELTVTDNGSPVDISNATAIILYFVRGTNPPLMVEGAFSTDGTDGKIRYVIKEGDIHVPGLWQVQAHVITPAGGWWSGVGRFEVESNLVNVEMEVPEE